MVPVTFEHFYSNKALKQANLNIACFSLIYLFRGWIILQFLCLIHSLINNWKILKFSFTSLLSEHTYSYTTSSVTFLMPPMTTSSAYSVLTRYSCPYYSHFACVNQQLPRCCYLYFPST